MKGIVRVILTALLLCALLLTGCSEAAQGATPSGDPPEETLEPADTPEAGDGRSTEQETPDPAPEDQDDPPLPDPPDEAADPPGEAADPPGETADPPGEEPPPVRLGETEDAGREYLDKLYFLGDSTTYWMGYYYAHGYSEDLIPSSHIWTGATGTMTLAYYETTPIVYETGEALSIREAVERAKPEYLVITLGVNGISFMNEEWFIRAYTAIINIVKEASPETKLILNSIFPIATIYPYWKSVNNDKIRTANGWIEQIAADTDVRFINSYECVADEEGNLPLGSVMHNDIGLHMNAESFQKVMYYFRTHAYK